MRLLSQLELFKTLSTPLTKRVDQSCIEQWSASLWNLVKDGPVTGQPFTMMLPPPNVTGNLHLGHALTASIEDTIIRHRRMSGRDTAWIPGFDHAGLATQSIVEQVLIRQEKQTRQEIGRDKFTRFANEWKDVKRFEMKGQLNRMGLELDYSKEFFTTDEKSSKAVKMAFKNLFEKGLIYRDHKPVYWSKQLGSTLSDIEIVDVNGIKQYIRTNEKVETRLIPQWFIKTDDIARRAVQVVNDKSIDIIPPNYIRVWSNWLLDNGVQDWCISRQSWWGHQIPAYKDTNSDDKEGNWIVADNFEEAQRKLKSQDIVQDMDVLDTWFSSSLLPLTISGWPDEKVFNHNVEIGRYPLDIMETGYDILTFWVSKMVMICLALVNEVPFKTVLLHGMICDSDGKKMSKSKGNVIDPIDLIEGSTIQDLISRTNKAYDQGFIEKDQLDGATKNQLRLFPNGIPGCGADGLRAYLLSQDFQEEIFRVQIHQIVKVRKLMNKIWNVTRLLINHIDSIDDKSTLNFDPIELQREVLDDSDINILKDQAECVYIAEASLGKSFTIHNLMVAIENFWTKSLSSIYLGEAKTTLNGDHGPEARKIKIDIFAGCVDTSLRLLHPIMPHLTEFLYQKILFSINHSGRNIANGEKLVSIKCRPYPQPQEWKKYYDSYK